MPIDASPSGTLDIENATLRSRGIVALTNMVAGNDVVRSDGPALEVYGDPGPRLELVSNTLAAATATFTRLESNVGVFSIQSGADASTNGPITFGGFANERMRIDADGNVGVGTVDPTHGRMQILCSSQSPDGGLTIRGGDFAAGLGAMWVQGSGSGQRFNIQAYKNESLADPSGVNPSTADVDAHFLCLNPKGGNVGVGTDSPNRLLDISDDSGETAMHISGLTTQSNVFIYMTETSSRNYGGVLHYSGTGTPQGLRFGHLENSTTNIRYDMAIDRSTGRVGIGTTNPAAPLMITSTNNSDTWTVSTAILKIANPSAVSQSYGLSIGVSSTHGDGVIQTYNQAAGASYDLQLQPVSGNVGIGHTNPLAKFHVNGPEMRITNVDTGVAQISAFGSSQGTGRLYVGQSGLFGGGIEYNGDNSPVSTGAGADYTTLYRVNAGSFSWTARNVYSSNQWEFRTAIINSDDRVKENEKYIRGATGTLMKIKPQLYDKKPSIESTDTKEWFCESGLIAQELYYDAPELRHLVKIPRDARDIDTNISITSADPTVDPDYSAWGKDTTAVNYVGLVPYLIKSVQEITTELPRHKTPVSNITPQNVEDFVGMIVCKRGSVELSTKSEDKACYGVISEINCDTQNNEILVNSSGEGKIWVTNLTGNVEAGDLITTSNIVGYGELQNSSVLSNFTVAKLTEDCDFNPPSTPVRRIRQEMSNVTVYSVTREVRVTEEEYNELAEEDRTTENRITYFDSDKQIDFDTYSNLESNTLRTETTLVFKLIHRHTSRTMREGYTPEVRQELVNVLDEHGQIQWEDHPTETERAYKIRYLDANGVVTDEANHVHKAAFVGCTYHCG